MAALSTTASAMSTTNLSPTVLSLMISVSFQNMSKRFDKHLAVDNVSLDIRAGELFFLLGPSGCGKTTCLRLVAGFYQPDGGMLRFGDREMNRVPPHLRNTGMVFQNYALWPHLTAKGNVEYGLKVRKVAREERERRTQEALELVRLGGLVDRYPNQLSGGQQQRVALARALVIQPDVLLLDEPLSNLDAQLRLEMRREIKRLHEATGVTAIYVTHDQNEALSIADRVAVMRDGKIEQVGTPREVYRTPRTRFVAEFIGETNFIPGVLKDFDARVMQVETPVGVLRALRQDEASWQAGQQVWCSIRPEAWIPENQGAIAGNTSATANGVNRVQAVVESIIYLGETEQIGARLIGAEETAQANPWRTIKISRLNPLAEVGQTGEPITLTCAPQDVVVLSE
jgi:iron(III) transport system ATP-binding protein